MKIFKEKENNFFENLKSLLDFKIDEDIELIDQSVKNIINDVKLNGDRALIKYTKKFDNTELKESEILITKETIAKNKKKIDKKLINSFKLAIKNITNFHKKQFPRNYEINKNNSVIGSSWKPIESVGLYVPGGKASYPSSLLMSVIPAKVAGVERIAIVTPSTNGYINPYITSLADILDIKEMYQVGGPQAIAALAFGTSSIKSVNKIFGPGNAYVASAKKQVFGKVGIDLIAGPSEIVVVADKDNNPDWVASDLIAQAEHDEKAKSILITDDEGFAKDVSKSVRKFMKLLPKQETIEKSINTHGAILILDNLKDSAKVINIIAPEHLHLQNKLAEHIFKEVKNAGCIFLGSYSSEAFGDYIIGTNHILPTSGSAKFSSGLGVLDFMKRSSFVRINKESYKSLSNHVIEMASIENLEGHKLSVKIRQKDKK